MTDALSTTGAVPLGDEQAGRIPILGRDTANPMSARNMFLALGGSVSIGQAVPVDPEAEVLPTVLLTLQGQQNGGDEVEELRIMLPPVLADQIEEALGEALEALNANLGAMKAEAAAETARRSEEVYEQPAVVTDTDRAVADTAEAIAKAPDDGHSMDHPAPAGAVEPHHATETAAAHPLENAETVPVAE